MNRFQKYFSWLCLIGIFLLISRIIEQNISWNRAHTLINQAVSSWSMADSQRLSLLEKAKHQLVQSNKTPEIPSNQYALLDLSDTSMSVDEILQIGDIWFGWETFETAQYWYGMAIDIEPTHSLSWYKLGLAYEMDGQNIPAIIAYEEGIKHQSLLVPDNDLNISDSFCHIGWLLRKDPEVRDLSRAENQLRKGLEVDKFLEETTKSNCLMELGTVLRWRGQPPDNYLPFYEAAMAVDDQNVQALIFVGVGKFALTGDVALAESYINQSIAIAPSVRAYQELAEIYELASEYDKAVISYETALEISINNQFMPAIQANIDRIRSEHLLK